MRLVTCALSDFAPASKMVPQTGISAGPWADIFTPLSNTAETYSLGNLPLWRLARVVRSGAGWVKSFESGAEPPLAS